ncbi:MAG: family 43 glycosylhydrolase, partial [Acidimicrobiales bacterium]|nr:family 43 glycosylhydrolase [Acidimicrobiales bacterium]
MTAVALAAGVLTAALWTDVQARARAGHEQAALGRADAHLAALRRDVASTEHADTVTTTQRAGLRSSISSTLEQLTSLNSVLASTDGHAVQQGDSIDVIQTCLGGVQNALNQIAARNNGGAAGDISAVSGPCSQLDGGSIAGLVYPFDFPDPAVTLVGQTYFAYATNSVAGNIQIVQSNDLTDWTAVGNALPSLPAWAAPDFTWAPAVAQLGGKFLLYYAADVAGSETECISVATADQPQGPFIDASTAPLECQPALGGSIDPDSFVDTNGTPYLVWKSGGPGSSRLWSEQLAPSGTAMAPGAAPTLVLTPDQGWQAGTVEAPDLVAAGGRYFLFYSGNDWNSANYAVGVALCAGPSGPCRDVSPTPVLAGGPGVAGPGGETVFSDTAGSYWVAFHAWVPGAVGFPNSRDLYL